jgi:hypothetical protein
LFKEVNIAGIKKKAINSKGRGAGIFVKNNKLPKSLSGSCDAI